MGASVSAIPHSVYEEIRDEIAPAEIEDIDVTIKLANIDTISPIGILRDVEILCGKKNVLLIFLFLVTHKMTYVPLSFGRPFLNTVNAKIDCKKQTVSVIFGDESHEFNFSKFSRNHHEK